MKAPVLQRDTMTEIVAFVCLVTIGASLRVGLHELPNFAPVAAMALFAGYFFRSMLLAACVPLGVMIISDQFLGGYDWYMMAMVYGMLLFPVLLRTPVRKLFRVQQGRVPASIMSFLGLFGVGLGCSVLFFLVTNFSAWLEFGYERSWSGLLQSYQMGIPFFRYTLIGDAAFGFVLFGSYTVALNCNWVADADIVKA